jgi:hypothetical protein
MSNCGVNCGEGGEWTRKTWWVTRIARQGEEFHMLKRCRLRGPESIQIMVTKQVCRESFESKGVAFITRGDQLLLHKRGGQRRRNVCTVKNGLDPQRAQLSCILEDFHDQREDTSKLGVAFDTE